MNKERKYPLNGVQVFWDNAPTPRKNLLEVLDAHGYGTLLPDEMTNEKALRQALSAFTSEVPPPGGHVWMIRGLKHLKQNGYEVKLERKDETENDASQAFRVKIVNGSVVIENDTLSYSVVPMVTGVKQQRIQELYDTSKATVAGADVGAILTRILKSYRPMVVALRPMGGLYWIPEDHSDRFERLCDDLEESCPGNVVTPMNWEMTPKCLRSVKDRMSTELEKEGSAIMKEIMSGTLGEEALENRLRRCVELQDEIVANEEILGEFGERMSSALSIAQQAATQGMMIV
jgi:hypothetical protein